MQYLGYRGSYVRPHYAGPVRSSGDLHLPLFGRVEPATHAHHGPPYARQ